MCSGDLVTGSSGVCFGFFFSRLISLFLLCPGHSAAVGCGGIPRQPVHLLDHWKHFRRHVSLTKSETNYYFGASQMNILGNLG